MAGLRWCIGDGNSVHVTRDPWLPIPYHFKVRTPSPLLPEKVSNLIDPVLRQWDVQTVCHVFNKKEADSIVFMALSRFGCPNHLMWHFTKNGLFTVKSGYRVAVELDSNGLLGRRGGGGTSVDKGGRRLWKSIWGLNIARKIHHFESGRDRLLSSIAYGLWRLWKCRNSPVFEGISVHPAAAVELMIKQQTEFL
ncbi:PREDICTED: reverse mRNAase [Prunus dulcis]|uniref:PREDICTED: reverse mRNAase n=1 Tax=Prunus dulcis TaxID=3755 RepID=A0A5E4GJZ7_PRUDU|nr:PREDICTED: reverse mRNAase [Prunus dulcis]